MLSEGLVAHKPELQRYKAALLAMTGTCGQRAGMNVLDAVFYAYSAIGGTCMLAAACKPSCSISCYTMQALAQAFAPY